MDRHGRRTQFPDLRSNTDRDRLFKQFFDDDQTFSDPEMFYETTPRPSGWNQRVSYFTFLPHLQCLFIYYFFFLPLFLTHMCCLAGIWLVTQSHVNFLFVLESGKHLVIFLLMLANFFPPLHKGEVTNIKFNKTLFCVVMSWHV